MKCIVKASAESVEFLKSMGAGQRTISQFYLQIMEERATKQRQRQK